MKKIIIVALLGLSLTGCGSANAIGNNVVKKDVSGTECVVANSSSGDIAVDCNWSER